ncbi:hypothetical protein Pcinc_024399 [Petrolisthes cinctipes]|uniref:Uncharacterized protein n=1 Tax=Petrolisthes cinctipes TaxID=88211 RepID=A0AAE1FCR6_PETCI|nr:hypothetical protein Pcinc_024399 [Petrolisthes cinctipes]
MGEGDGREEKKKGRGKDWEAERSVAGRNIRVGRARQGRKTWLETELNVAGRWNRGEGAAGKNDRVGSHLTRTPTELEHRLAEPQQS